MDVWAWAVTRRARHNLAVVYQQQGKSAEAEAQWRLVTGERPDFALSWLGLGDLHLSQGRWGDVENDARALEGPACAPEEAAALRGRSLLARGDFAAARTLLERAASASPKALRPRVILTHVLLQEGRDPAAPPMGQRCRDVLQRLDPQNAEARHNLSLLRQQRNLPPADAVFVENVPLAQMYLEACRTSSDINEHLPTLHALAKECRHVTELGTRTGVSTTALLYAQPDKLICYDRVKYPQVDRLARAAGRTEFVFHEKDVLWADIEETDLLFIDTWHVYEQLREELRRHAGKARKFIVLHDTTTFAEQGETEGHMGLWPAVEEFLAKGISSSFERGTRTTTA